jgi:hypothetical protein
VEREELEELEEQAHAVMLRVSIDGDHVVMHFAGPPCSWIGVDAPTARQLARLLVSQAATLERAASQVN